jgi:hypothetical protein
MTEDKSMSFRHLPKRERLRIQKEIRQENEKFTSEFVEFSVDKFKHSPKFFNKPTKAFRNKRFSCLVFTHEGFTRLSISRTSINENGDYLDGITWDELFEIKNKVGFADCDAVEVYPAEKDLTFVTNMRHLWIVENLPFIWRSK